MSELLALAERCEKATGPDRELDGEIYCAINIVIANCWPHWTRAQRDDLSPHFTASIDAAMTLGDPAAEISISTLYGVARVEYPLNYSDALPCHGEHIGGLIAPAICAAILRAYAELASLRARAAEVRSNGIREHDEVRR